MTITSWGVSTKLEGTLYYMTQSNTENAKDDLQSHKGWNVKLSRSEREGKE